jgi:hypothetical protein
MGFFQTKDPKTGEPRLGAGVYLIICALMIGGVVLWNIRQHAHEPGFGNEGPAATGPSNPTSVQTIAKAAVAHEETTNVKQATGIGMEIKSARGVEFHDDSQSADTPKKAAAPDDMDTIQDTVELLRSNQEKAEREKAEAVAQAKAQAEAEASAEIEALKKKAAVTSSAEGTPGPGGQTGASGKGLSSGSSKGGSGGSQASGISAGGLTIYDYQRDTKPTQDKVAIPTGFDTNDFLPRGTIFPVYILSTVQTVNQEDMVVMAVAENVIFQHKIQLPFGTRLLGTAGGSNFEDRVMIDVDTILYPDGRELPISGFLKDASDLSSGVRGYYIPQPFAIQMTPFVAEFIDLWTQATAQRFSSEHISSNGGTTYTSALSNASDLINQQANKIQTRLDRRYIEKVVVPIGTKAYVSLRSPLDLTKAHIAGSLDSKQVALPGFENNPIAPNGTLEKAGFSSAPTKAGAGGAAGQTQAQQQQAQAAAQAQQQQTQQQAQAAKNAQIQQLMQALKGGNSSAGDQVAAAPPSVSPNISWPTGDVE